jgi:CubicO group peptidase (beta-lactamase class C family)
MLQSTAREKLQALLDEHLPASGVPGFVAGMWWDGDSFELSSGTANLNTGDPMAADTAFLLGSVTKVLVTTMLLRFVERGLLSLDDRVIDRLPELELGDAATGEALNVRALLNHSSGIDAADFAPELGRGADAVRRYVALLADKGQLYPLGSHISYCNPAFVIAGRLLEVLSGETFDTLIAREIFAPIGMARSCTSGDQAILHRTAIGHIVDPETGVPRATRRFMLPYSMGPAGSTVITTIGDLLRFARVHLEGGRSSEGEQILSGESVAAMTRPTIREEGLGGFGVGLGWLLPASGPTRLLTHSGGSFGGISSLLVAPERRFAFAAFGNSTAAGSLHQKVQDFVLQEVLGLPPGPQLTAVSLQSGSSALQGVDSSRYIGTFQKQYMRTDISAGEDGALVATVTLDYDDDQRELHREYSGREVIPPVPLYPVTESFFVAGAQPTEPIPIARMPTAGMTFLDADERGHFRYLSSGLRISSLVDS